MIKAENNKIFILDYPNLLTTKKITKDGQKCLDELIKILVEFRKKHNITIDFTKNTENL